MGEIVSQMFAGPLKIIAFLFVLILVILYLVCILWVAKDARTRPTNATVWTIIAIIPIAGIVAYCLLRPDLKSDDRDELDMQLDYLQHELDKYGECPFCGYDIKADFVACPHCQHQLRNLCSRCGKVLEPDWTICPYCTTPVRPASK